MATDAAAQMSKLTLGGTPSMVAKREPGKLGRVVEINTNITPITLKKNVAYFKYDLRMYAIFSKKDGSEGVKEFSKQTKDDYNEQERKKACTEIFLNLSKTEATFKGDLIYDRAAILFSTQKLAGITGDDKKFTFPASCQTVCPDAIRVDVTIKQAADTFQVTSNDLVSCVNADFKGHSKGLMEVLNLATSQIPFFSPKNFIVYGNGNIYLLDPSQYGFVEAEAPAIGQDKYTGIGLSKGVKILEGNNKPGGKDYMPALVLDVKKTAFHFDAQVLTEKIMNMYGNTVPNLAILNRDLKDIRCLTVHKKASLIIGGFTSGPVGKATFKDKDGKTLSIVDYYQTKYKMKIARPDLPGVICKHQRNIYPTCLLKVAPNQRVKATQATKETVETLIKVSAIKPEIRFKQTQRLSQLLQLNSKQSEALGVTVPANQPVLSVPARQLNAVNLQGGGGTMQGPSWRGAPKFVVGAKIERWAAFLFYNPSARARYPADQTFTGFVGKLMEAGNRKGMSIPNPVHTEKIEVRGHVEPLVTEAIKKAAAAGCTYVLIVSDDRIKSHDQLKYEELVYKLTTQEVTLAKAAQVAFENKGQTMENIIMKTNVKLRGMNHVTATDGIGLHHSPDTLILGIFVQQPRGMSAKEIEGGAQPSMPAVIGLSANNGNLQAAPPAMREAAAQQYFTTAWKYANPKEWEAGETQRDTLKNMVVAALMQFKANRGKIPTKVIVYRGGVSEGQLPYIASAERDVFHAAFASLNASYKPALVIIACSKEHNERFYHKTFPTAAPGARVDTNLAPGIIVDKVAVNPEMNEFYLQAHKALQGTAKATKYTLLHESTGKLTNDQIQHTTNALCHLHEIVNSTTAVPTPLYVAEESAKRAVNIYHHIKGSFETYDLDEINKNLSPTGLGARINA